MKVVDEKMQELSNEVCELRENTPLHANLQEKVSEIDRILNDKSSKHQRDIDNFFFNHAVI